jgi:hypothetical protein
VTLTPFVSGGKWVATATSFCDGEELSDIEESILNFVRTHDGARRLGLVVGRCLRITLGAESGDPRRCFQWITFESSAVTAGAAGF